MSSVKKEVVEVELKGIELLLSEVVLGEKVNRKMSEKELLNFVYENFNNEECKSKNSMLKFLRGSGLSCSMDRLFNMYKRVEKVCIEEKRLEVIKEDKEKEKVSEVKK